MCYLGVDLGVERVLEGTHRRPFLFGVEIQVPQDAERGGKDMLPQLGRALQSPLTLPPPA